MIRLTATCNELGCRSSCIIHTVDDDSVDLWQYCMCNYSMEDLWILFTPDLHPTTIFKRWSHMAFVHFVDMQLTLYNRWHNVINLGWKWTELDHWPFWHSFVTCVSVAYVTTDFVMQNVILQISLWLLSPSEIHVHELHCFVPSFIWS